ncbi:hypothetical protein NMY22_g18058 [Coprinellus aureogranulatus]|nr:hypothetical protein NMY22_g18058 [Coprinellus aureogranulatus]
MNRHLHFFHQYLRLRRPPRHRTDLPLTTSSGPEPDKWAAIGADNQSTTRVIAYLRKDSSSVKGIVLHDLREGTTGLTIDCRTMSASELPYEVLARIFVACLPDWPSYRLLPTNAPMLVCQVSSDWRRAAIGEPRLWDTILFPSCYDPLNYYARFIQDGNIQRWFDRTGTSWPLTFGEDASESPATSRILQYLPVITKYARRFKHLSLVMIKIMHLETFRRGFPQDIFDQLESVTLCCELEMNSYTLQAFPKLVTPFQTAKKLKHVSFSLHKADPTKFVLPWSNITSIDVDSRRRPLELEEWHDVFKTCTRLRRASFVWPACRGPWDGFKPVIHTSLKSLTLIPAPRGPHEGMFFDYGHNLSFLLSAVEFPNLQHLRFEFEPGRKPIQSLLDGCQGLQSSLQTVVFGWQGDWANSPGYGGGAPKVEASEFVSALIREPGSFATLRHLVLPCRSNKVNHIATALLSHPKLSVTITVVAGQIVEWTGAIEGYDRSKQVGLKQRVTILSTDDYHLLDEETYFDKFLLAEHRSDGPTDIS